LLAVLALRDVGPEPIHMDDTRSTKSVMPTQASPGEGQSEPAGHAAPTTPTRFRSLSDPESLRLFARNLREGIYITARDGRILDANAAFLDTVGVGSLRELEALGASGLFADPARRDEQMALLERNGFVREFEIELRRPDGQTRTVLDTGYLIRDPDTGEGFIHGILFDITSRKALEASLVEMSTHDALTGVLNRRHLVEFEERLAADPDLKFGCIFVDIDHFKIYNDRWGHQQGDQVLRHMARFLMRYVRAEEAVLRVGGDEFVVLLSGATVDQTKIVADRLRIEALERAPVPFSLGWAAREHGEGLHQVLDRADQGMMAVRVIKRQTDPRQHPAIPKG
jgi:diguanylate cyclase (GGDEF)-like protein/PAS domain S-box-containing protein